MREGERGKGKMERWKARKGERGKRVGGTEGEKGKGKGKGKEECN